MRKCFLLGFDRFMFEGKLSAHGGVIEGGSVGEREEGGGGERPLHDRGQDGR